jgi:predicted ribonuclease YlaK
VVRVIIPLIVVDELDELKRTARDKADRAAVRAGVRELKDTLEGSSPVLRYRLPTA